LPDHRYVQVLAAPQYRKIIGKQLKAEQKPNGSYEFHEPTVVPMSGHRAPA
jgi:hypothetical protein